LVRAFEAEQEAARRFLHEILSEGTTSNVSVQQHLELGSVVDMADFVRDCMALANTRSSGRRFLVLGLDKDTQQVSSPVDVTLTKDRVDELLRVHTVPAPRFSCQRIKTSGGDVVIIELFHDADRVPSRVGRNLGPLKVGQVFVRHGRISEGPTPRELADLEAEGIR
jgi:hypothetical protein